MKKEQLYPKRKINYEEIMNRKLKKFYIVIHVITVNLFIGEGVLLKVLYLRVEALEKKWCKGSQDWRNVQNQLAILFDERYTKYI